MGEHVGIVWIELERAQQLPAGTLVVAAVEPGDAEHAMRPMVPIVELDRPSRELERLLAQKKPVVPGEAGPLVQIGHREPDIGARELRVPGHGLLEAAARLGERRRSGRLSALQPRSQRS